MNIIFIPGSSCTVKVWGELNLLREHNHCIDADVVSFDSIEQMADQLVKRIDSSKRYSIIGLSMGGYVALELATRTYDWIEKLVLLNTSANSVAKETIPDRQKAMHYAANNEYENLLAVSIGHCFLEKKKEYIALEREMAIELGGQVFINQQNAIINRKSYLGALANIKAATLIVSSKHDEVIDYHDSFVMYEKIQSSELVMFNNVGHLPTIENGKHTLNMVNLFLDN